MSSDSELIKNQNSSALPIITFDLDGVLCNPIFGLNLGINNSPLDPKAESVPANIPPIWLRLLWDTIRFEFRRPISGAVQALTQLQANYSLIQWKSLMILLACSPIWYELSLKLSN